jgi:N-acetylmuramate 1-kinase
MMEAALQRLNQVLTNSAYKSIQPLTGDASTRKYFRVMLPHETTRLAMVMPNPGANEEQSFIQVQHFLSKNGLPVPEIFEHHENLGIVILQDLGDDLVENAEV